MYPQCRDGGPTAEQLLGEGVHGWTPTTWEPDVRDDDPTSEGSFSYTPGSGEFATPGDNLYLPRIGV